MQIHSSSDRHGLSITKSPTITNCLLVMNYSFRLLDSNSSPYWSQRQAFRIPVSEVRQFLTIHIIYLWTGCAAWQWKDSIHIPHLLQCRQFKVINMVEKVSDRQIYRIRKCNEKELKISQKYSTEVLS